MNGKFTNLLKKNELSELIPPLNIPKSYTETEYNETVKQYFLSSFRLCFPKSFNLISEIVNDLIFEMSTEYYFNIKHNRNNKLIADAVHNLFTLKIYHIIENEGFSLNDYYSLKSNDQHRGLTGILQQYEKTSSKDATGSLKGIFKHILSDNLKGYLLLIKMFSLLLVSETSKKDLMKELGIYKLYKPQGNKYSEERELIYSFIPSVKNNLLEENKGKNKKGKTDIKAAVRTAIKTLENRKLITRNKHNPDKIYDSYLKYNPNRVYQDLIQ